VLLDDLLNGFDGELKRTAGKRESFFEAKNLALGRELVVTQAPPRSTSLTGCGQSPKYMNIHEMKN